MKFDTTRFGQIDVKSEDVINFPEGLLGFPDCKKYTVIEDENSEPFKMLQSLDNPALAFVIIDPIIAQPKYHFNVTSDELKYVKAENTDNLAVYVIVTMAANVKDVTVNLQGPLVFNTLNNLGHQFVLVNTPYTTREKLLWSEEELAQESDTVAISHVEDQKKAM